MRKLAITIITAAMIITGSIPVFAKASDTITESDAKAIALNHAGVAEEDAEFINAIRVFDDGYEEYEVQFYVGATEYDYDVDAHTGAVLSFDQDFEYSRAAKVSEKAMKALTESDAVEVALNHAGVSKNETRYTRVQKDFENGISIYEIEFCVNDMEYEYEIAADTGAVLGYDIEIDD